jgi:hypothetical protein
MASPRGQVRELLPRKLERGRFIMTRTIGAILIVLGLIGLAWGGFTYTTKKKVLDIGPIEATREEHHNVPVPPIAGAVALVGGIVLIAADRRT